MIGIDNEIKNGHIVLSSENEIGKMSYGTGNIQFIRTSDISNWELKADPKQGVSEEIYETFFLFRRTEN
jgi:type I restriction enzyme M protein